MFGLYVEANVNRFLFTVKSSYTKMPFGSLILL